MKTLLKLPVEILKAKSQLLHKTVVYKPIQRVTTQPVFLCLQPSFPYVTDRGAAIDVRPCRLTVNLPGLHDYEQANVYQEWI